MVTGRVIAADNPCVVEIDEVYGPAPQVWNRLEQLRRRLEPLPLRPVCAYAGAAPLGARVALRAELERTADGWALEPIADSLVLLPDGEPAVAAPAAELARQLEQLGSRFHFRRAAARRALAELGAAAVPALRQAASHADLEVRSSARELLDRLAGERRREILVLVGHSAQGQQP